MPFRRLSPALFGAAARVSLLNSIPSNLRIEWISDAETIRGPMVAGGSGTLKYGRDDSQHIVTQFGRRWLRGNIVWTGGAGGNRGNQDYYYILGAADPLFDPLANSWTMLYLMNGQITVDAGGGTTSKNSIHGVILGKASERTATLNTVEPLTEGMKHGRALDLQVKSNVVRHVGGTSGSSCTGCQNYAAMTDDNQMTLMVNRFDRTAPATVAGKHGYIKQASPTVFNAMDYGSMSGHASAYVSPADPCLMFGRNYGVGVSTGMTTAARLGVTCFLQGYMTNAEALAFAAACFAGVTL